MDISGVYITIAVVIGLPIVWYLLCMMFACHVVRAKHVAIIERNGKFHQLAQPGLYYLWPYVDRFRNITIYHDEPKSLYNNRDTARSIVEETKNQLSLNERVFELGILNVITEDNVSIFVRSVMMCRVSDPIRFVYEMENMYFIERLLKSTLRGLLGNLSVDECFSSRHELTNQLLDLIRPDTTKWGVEVTDFHIISISPSVEIQNSMHKLIRSERKRRANVVSAYGYREAQRLEAEAEAFRLVVSSQAAGQVIEINQRGKAQTLLLRSKAEAEALQMLQPVLAPIGVCPVKYSLAVKYMQQLFDTMSLAKNKKIIMPLESMPMDALESVLRKRDVIGDVKIKQ